jgi:hypothetical protein
MGNPVGGPLKTIAVELRELSNGSKESSFRLARRILRALNEAGWAVRHDKAAAKDNAKSLLDLFRDFDAALEADAKRPKAPARVEPPPPPPPPPPVVHAPPPEPAPSEKAAPAVEGPEECAVQRRSGRGVSYRLVQAPGHEWVWKLAGIACKSCGPLMGEGAPEGPLRHAIDLAQIRDATLDALDALDAKRPDLAKEDLEFITDFLETKR